MLLQSPHALLRPSTNGGTGPVVALFTGDNMIPLSEFPAIDATLNATSALLLSLGYFFIRRKKIQAHKVCMLSPFATSALFSWLLSLVPRSPWRHSRGKFGARLALGCPLCLSCLRPLTPQYGTGPARGVYSPYSAGRVVGVPRVRWCSEAVPAILSLIPLATPLIY